PAAEQALRRAIELQPTMADAAVVLADVLNAAGCFLEAEAELRRALDIRPEYAGAALNLALLYWNRDQIDEAERMLVHAKSLDSTLASIDVSLGSLYLKVGRTSEATSAFRRALEENGTSDDVCQAFLFSRNFDPELDAT